MGCLTKAFVMALGVAAAVGLTSKFHQNHAQRPRHTVQTTECAHVAPTPLHIWADGSVTFGKTRYTNRKLLAARFKEFGAHSPPMPVHVLPDKHSRYDDVAAVFKLARNARMACMGLVGIPSSQ